MEREEEEEEESADDDVDEDEAPSNAFSLKAAPSWQRDIARKAAPRGELISFAARWLSLQLATV